MSYVKWKIEHTPFVNNKWVTASTAELTGFYDILLRSTIGTGKDSFEFKLTNFNSTYNNYFNSNDKITIYKVVNSESFSTSDIVMVGTCNDIPEEYSGTKNQIRITGKNFSESIAGAIVFVDLNNKTIPEALEFALTNAGSKNPNFKVEWDSSNPSVRSDGSAFPTIQGSIGKFFNKPLIKIIEKYSTNQETGDGNYYWYINNQNKFIWRKRSSTINDTFNTSTDEFQSIKISKDIKGVKNFIILKGGIDPEGNQIQTRYVAWSSVAKHGTKWYFYVDENTGAKNLINQDLQESYGGDPLNNSYPASYPFETTWTWSGADGTVSGLTVNNGAAVTVTSDAEYVSAIRAEVKVRLDEAGRQIAEDTQYGKLNVELTFRAGQKSWGLGDNIQCTIPQIDSTPFNLRIKDIQNSTTTDKFILEEDKGSL